MTAHGSRSIASTRLNEQGWNTEAIERHLAHVEGNALKAAYSYVQHLPLGRKMMRAWADYLESLCSPAQNVLTTPASDTSTTESESKNRTGEIHLR